MLFKSLSICLSLCFWFPILEVKAQNIEEENKISICKSEFNDKVNSLINSEEFKKSNWGILIENLSSNAVFYELNSDKFFIPASNVKLLITASSLLTLSPDFIIKTPILTQGKAPILNSLIVQGKGDPTLKTEDLQAIVKQLKNQGITTINNLIIDDSYFSEFGLNNSWEWSDLLTYYAPNINSLILNENSVILTIFPQNIGDSIILNWSDEIAGKQWQIDNKAITSEENTVYNLSLNSILGKPILAIRGNLPMDNKPDVWGLAIPDPNTYFLQSLEQLLLDEGIKVINTNIVTSATEKNYNFDNVIYIESENLTELITEINQNSNNLFAESLFKILQIESQNNGFKESLTTLGINPDNYKLVDGSGLSRQNLVTPKTIVNTLKLMSLSPYQNIYQESLSIAGINGTLKNRFQNTNVVGKLRGKTGSLTGVSALSGYLERENFPPLVFSIIVNNTEQSTKLQRQTIDQIVILLRNLNDGC